MTLPALALGQRACVRLGREILAPRTTAGCPIAVDFDRKGEACITRLATKYLNQMNRFGRGSWIRTNDLQYPKLPRYQAALYPDLWEETSIHA